MCKVLPHIHLCVVYACSSSQQFKAILYLGQRRISRSLKGRLRIWYCITKKFNLHGTHSDYPWEFQHQCLISDLFTTLIRGFRSQTIPPICNNVRDRLRSGVSRKAKCQSRGTNLQHNGGLGITGWEVILVQDQIMRV